jgi:hypothetical protein
MPDRIAILTLHTKGADVSLDQFGFNDSIRAVCTLNFTILAFHVFEYTPTWVERLFGLKHEFILQVDLANPVTGRPYGRKSFNTAEEAIEHGKEFLLKWFPTIEEYTKIKEEANDDTR